MNSAWGRKYWWGPLTVAVPLALFLAFEARESALRRDEVQQQYALQIRTLTETSAPRIAVSENGVIKMATVEADELFGVGRGELVGRSVDEFFASSIQDGDCEIVDANGKRIPVKIRASFLDFQGAKLQAVKVRPISQ